jgi:hypothetical protein
VTNERYPSCVILQTVLTDAIRENEDLIIRRKASSVIKRILVYNHPPSSLFMRSHYLRSFFMKKNDPKVKIENIVISFHDGDKYFVKVDHVQTDVETFWEFFYDLVCEVIELDKTSESHFKDSGVVLLLDLVIFVIELDLTFVVKE